jgi:hypothetical protein
MNVIGTYCGYGGKYIINVVAVENSRWLKIISIREWLQKFSAEISSLSNVTRELGQLFVRDFVSSPAVTENTHDAIIAFVIVVVIFYSFSRGYVNSKLDNGSSMRQGSLPNSVEVALIG